jgi:soluble lytic murein transglycosylase-like protein
MWSAIEPAARARRIDPGFVYALVRVESDFDPRASRGENRGLLQIKPRLWRSVSAVPYEPAVWDWKENLRVGLDVLSAIKQRLRERGVFSYPLLWASYHYGEDYVAGRGFDMSRIPRPSDDVAYRLWSGEIHPVAPPKDLDGNH